MDFTIKTNLFTHKVAITILFFIYSTGLYASYLKINGKKYNTYYFNQYNKKSIDYLGYMEASKPVSTNKYYHYTLHGKRLYKLGFKNSSAHRVGNLLAKYYIQKQNYKKAEEIYRFNITVEPYRYEARMNLINLLKKTQQYTELIKLTKEVIDLPIKVPSNKINEYKETALKTYSRLIKKYPILNGSLSKEHTITSKILKKKLPYKIYLPTKSKINGKLPVIYINDGFNYIRKGKVPKILDSLITNNIIQPVAAIFLNPRDLNNNNEKIRNELFWCNPKFDKFFTKEFFPLIEKTVPVSNNRKDRTILGVSFGGLAAAYLGQNSKSFKNIAMQSPAFGGCKSIYTSFPRKAKMDLKIYLSYGTGKDTEKQDLPMIRTLVKKKYQLTVKRIVGGDHNWKIWKPQLAGIFIHFYGVNKN